MNTTSSFHKTKFTVAAIFIAVLPMAAWDIWAEQQRSLTPDIIATESRHTVTTEVIRSQPATDRVRELSPKYLLQIHSTRLPELQAWATNWESETSVHLSHLSELIAKSDLSAVECLQIGELIAHDEGYPAGKVWITAGYQRAVTLTANDEENRNSLNSLVSAMVSAENHLHGRVDAAPLLEQLTAFIIHFSSTNKWDQTSKWGRIHHVDALLLEGRNIDAKVEAEAMDRDAKGNPHWDSKLKSELKLLKARIPFEPEAHSPLDVLNLHHPEPKELLAWFAAQQAAQTNNQGTGDEAVLDMTQSSLLILVEKSDLSSLECLRIAELMADGPDASDAEVFASVGTDRALTDLKNLSDDDVRARPMLNALKRMEQRLWESPAGEIDRGVTLEKINRMLMRFARENPWDQTLEWARIGHGEALYMQHRYSEALTEANQLAIDSATDDHFTRQEKSGINWLQALLLFDTGRFAEAVPHLEATATCTGFAHARDAWPMWAVALAKSGDSARANRVFDDWIRQKRPPIDAAAHVLEAIQGH